ncbi:MAG: hypothetical protein R2875_03565 [Desulfobacterales bacterium]
MLIQEHLPGNQYNCRIMTAAADPSAPLPGGHDSPRIPHQQAQIEITDIDTEFRALVEITANSSPEDNFRSMSRLSSGRNPDR